MYFILLSFAIETNNQTVQIPPANSQNVESGLLPHGLPLRNITLE